MGGLIGNSAGFILGTLYTLAVFIPGLAVGARRLHDIGKSGWMMLIVLIPFIGVFWLIYLLATEGDKGMNTYGPDPKDVAAAPQPSTEPSAPPTPPAAPQQ